MTHDGAKASEGGFVAAQPTEAEEIRDSLVIREDEMFEPFRKQLAL